MADITYRANLKSASFPFLSEEFGRSVIVKGQDQNYVGGLAAKETLDSSVGVPQLYYCHNVIPSEAGYRSVGYSEVVPPTFPFTSELGDVVTLRDSAGNSALLTVTALGVMYLLPAGSTTWVSPITPPAAATIAGHRLTVAFVDGVTYIYFANVGCYTCDLTTYTMSSVTLTGLEADKVLGLVGNRGYLLAYSEDTIAWSSTIDATDFVPSLESGAGSGQVQGARGVIVTVESIYGGMIVFTSGNAVAVTASDNDRYPYAFSELSGAGGLSNPAFVSYDANSGAVYAYTTSGLQSIGLQKAVTIFPEVTDFLSGEVFEDFDEVSNTLSTTVVAGSVIAKRLVVIADRYLVISYGAASLTHAIYYDILYKQFGKLRVDHIDCFELERGTVESPKKSMAFLANTGAISVLESGVNNSVALGVMILGKYQYVRTRFMQLQSVEFENVNQGAMFSLYDLPSTDGKNLLPAIPGFPSKSIDKLRAYFFHTTALNHSLLLKGNFNAVSVCLTFNVAGAR